MLLNCNYIRCNIIYTYTCVPDNNNKYIYCWHFCATQRNLLFYLNIIENHFALNWGSHLFWRPTHASKRVPRLFYIHEIWIYFRNFERNSNSFLICKWYFIDLLWQWVNGKPNYIFIRCSNRSQNDISETWTVLILFSV